MNVQTDRAPDVSPHYTGENGQRYFEWQGGGGAFAARIIAHKFRSHVKPSDVVIDFGCGGGFLLNELVCSRKIGVEVNPYSRAHALAAGLECVERLGEIPDHTADVAVSHHALEHVLNPIGVLRELRQKLKPGGRLVLCVPIDNWQVQKRYSPRDINHHLFTWTSQLLGNCLVEADFAIEDIKYRCHMWPRRWTVAAYGRLPYSVFNALCYIKGVLCRQGRELLAVATTPAN